MITDEKMKALVRAKYEKEYGPLKGFEVKDIAHDVLPGTLVNVIWQGTYQGREAGDDEVCYVKDGMVRIFETTQELIAAMVEEAKSTESVAELQSVRTWRQSLRTKAQWWFFGVSAVCTALFIVAFYLSASGTDRWRGFTPFLLGACGLVALLLIRTRVHSLEADIQELDYKIDLQLYAVSVGETRAEKILRLNELQLRRYYEMTLQQNGWVFWLGIGCIVLGVGISGTALYLVTYGSPPTGPAQLGEKIVTAALGAVGSLLTNYVAVIYLKMHAAAAGNLVTFHSRLVTTHQTLLGNLVASRIQADTLRETTLSKIALNLSRISGAPPEKAAEEIEKPEPAKPRKPSRKPGSGKQEEE